MAYIYNEIKSNLFIAFIFIVFTLGCLPANAITDGNLDGDEHPSVVLIIIEAGGYPTFRCSGVLLNPTVVLTTGHCVGVAGEFTGMRVFTESDVENGNNNYPFAGPNAVEATSWVSHPEYTDAEFKQHDVGIIHLAEPINIDNYAELPTLNELDRMARRRGHQDVSFTAVGYGLQRINPVFVESERVRMYAKPRLIQINTPGFTGDYSLLLSNNHSTGGTCYGDSGGPNFIGDSLVVGGVTSFGKNGNCAGTGGVFRMDRADVLNFVLDQLN